MSDKQNDKDPFLAGIMERQEYHQQQREKLQHAVAHDKRADNLTIESCVENMRDKWKMVDADCRDGNDGLITYHVSAFDEGLAYAQALTAKLREEHTHDLIREKFEVAKVGFVGGQASMREEIAGLQNMLRQKDEAIISVIEGWNIPEGVRKILEVAYYNITSPTAALEAVRAEDKSLQQVAKEILDNRSK